MEISISEFDVNNIILFFPDILKIVRLKIKIKIGFHIFPKALAISPPIPSKIELR